MSKEIENDDGTKETVYTQAELDAQLAEKDAHVAAKLDEFKQGKTAQELKDIERDAAIKAAKDAADAAVATANDTVAQARSKVVNFVAEQFVGTDPELRKKLDDAFKIIEEGRKATGLDIKDDASIQEMMRNAAGMAGLNSPAHMPVYDSGSSSPLNFQPKANEVSDAEHEAFLKATGYQDPNKKA